MFFTSLLPLFLSKKAYHAFKGYAHTQRHKILIKNPQANSKRYALIEQYGYDTKFAMHLIRLLYEAIDIFEHEEIIYPSLHVEELKDIRSGVYSLETVLAQAIQLEERIDTLYQKSLLQWAPDRDAIEKLKAGADLVQIYTGFIYEGPGFVKRINRALLQAK